MKKISILVGTRPNFIKVTQFRKEAELNNISLDIIHSGQHYDHLMSGVFFDQFKLKPDYFLNTKPGESPHNQIANIIIGLDAYVAEKGKPDLFLVVGDVNSTLAGAIFANKSGILLGHIESGLRSFDNNMPEELNRIVTDILSDYFFVTEESGYRNLINNNIDKNNIFFVGNTMIDTLVAFDEDIESSPILANLGLTPKSYILMTMHRPATVDNFEELNKLINVVDLVAKQAENLVFPIHPRTRFRLEKYNLLHKLVNHKQIIVCDPLGYFEFQKLIKNAKYVITDSGGIQEETTYNKVPCITLRKNTERPSTITVGSNALVLDLNFDLIQNGLDSISSKQYKVPELWDGQATKRIFKFIINNIFNK